MDPIELAVGILSEELTVPVSTEIPATRPQRMVAVTLDADNSTEYLMRVTLGLTCWGTSDRDAHGIAVSAVDALRDAALDHDLLSAVGLETMARDEWTKTGQAHYFASVELTVNVDE